MPMVVQCEHGSQYTHRFLYIIMYYLDSKLRDFPIQIAETGVEGSDLLIQKLAKSELK